MVENDVEYSCLGGNFVKLIPFVFIIVTELLIVTNLMSSDPL